MVYMSANSERVKRWRNRHRALHNLRRRNARKEKLGLVVEEAEAEAIMPRIEMAQDAKQGKLAALREMIEKESVKPSQTSVEVPPAVYRNDYGGVISKFAWEKLQRLKKHAKEKEFEIDEYSQ